MEEQDTAQSCAVAVLSRECSAATGFSLHVAVRLSIFSPSPQMRAAFEVESFFALHRPLHRPVPVRLHGRHAPLRCSCFCSLESLCVSPIACLLRSLASSCAPSFSPVPRRSRSPLSVRVPVASAFDCRGAASSLPFYPPLQSCLCRPLSSLYCSASVRFVCPSLGRHFAKRQR